MSLISCTDLNFGVQVAYDGSVRDCDGSIVQFLYGEDGIDTLKQLGLQWFDHLADNTASVTRSLTERTLEALDRKSYKKRIKEFKKEVRSEIWFEF